MTRLNSLPLLGFAIRWLATVIRLPSLFKSIEPFQAYTMALQTQAQDHINDWAKIVGKGFNGYQTRLAEMESNLTKSQNAALHNQQIKINEIKQSLEIHKEETARLQNAIQAEIQT